MLASDSLSPADFADVVCPRLCHGILNVSFLILFLSMMLQNTQAYVRTS